MRDKIIYLCLAFVRLAPVVHHSCFVVGYLAAINLMLPHLCVRYVCFGRLRTLSHAITLQSVLQSVLQLVLQFQVAIGIAIGIATLLDSVC
jgi:hypothetical protein